MKQNFTKYLLRMSNYKKGEWYDICDDLYYNFIDKHHLLLRKNYVIANQVKNWERKNKTNRWK